MCTWLQEIVLLIVTNLGSSNFCTEWVTELSTFRV